MIVLGIDPGQTGGLVLLEREHCKAPIKLIAAMLMPLTTKEHTSKPTVFVPKVEVWFGKATGLHFVELGVIENVHSMPAQGVASSFQFGRMFGAAEMIIQQWCEVQRYTTPQEWKKDLGLGPAKSAAMTMATNLYGDKHWKLRKHEGIAEAALIATWGMNQLLEK